jgi:hypothetical protein
MASPPPVDDLGSTVIMHLPSDEEVFKTASIVKGLAGGIVLAYGGHYPSSMLLFTGVSAAGGLALLSTNFAKLKATYLRTRKAVEDALPEVKKQVSEVARLEEELRVLYNDFQGKKIAESEYTAKSAVLHADVAALKEAIAKLSSSLQLIQSAVDVESLKLIVTDSYATIMHCVAVSSSKLAAQFSVGVSIGRGITRRLDAIAKANRHTIQSWFTSSSLSATARASNNPALISINKEILNVFEERDWIGTVASITGYSIGLVTAYILRSTAIAVGTASIGANLVTNAVEELVDPILKQYKLPTLKSNGLVVGALHGTLVVVGVSRILSRASPTGWTHILLSPLSATEAIVNAIILTQPLGL